MSPTPIPAAAAYAVVSLARVAVDNDWLLLDMHREQVSLEDTFRRLTIGDEGGAR